MISTSDFLHLPYTSDLTEGGIAYAVHSLPYTYNRMGGSPYERLRRIAAGVVVELAFRRYLSEHEIPFDVMGATPFTEPDRYDVSLGGRRCDIKSFLITHREQILEMKSKPQVVLNAPALVSSDQNAAEGHSNKDIYIFAFLQALVASSPEGVEKVIQNHRPYYLVHVMPDSWNRPMEWNPLGTLVLKSESEECLTVEIGGQDAGRGIRSLEIEVPPRTRIQVDNRFFSLAYVHSKSLVKARLGIHGPQLKETHIIHPSDWGNICLYGMDILLAGYLTRGEFNQRARHIREGARVFQYDRTRTKNLAVSVCDLKPLSELLEYVKNTGPL
ncbi:MAG TPA: hypothetical protein VJ785_07760 [Anaerolineales bacterium]|nr:hypothetical protein [Anaerolineales bacterium]